MSVTKICISIVDVLLMSSQKGRPWTPLSTGKGNIKGNIDSVRGRPKGARPEPELL